MSVALNKAVCKKCIETTYNAGWWTKVDERTWNEDREVVCPTVLHSVYIDEEVPDTCYFHDSHSSLYIEDEQPWD